VGFLFNDLPGCPAKVRFVSLQICTGLGTVWKRLNTKEMGTTMLFQPSMKKALAARGYHHCKSDDEFIRHGDYARYTQYAFSKEFKGPHEKVVDIIFLGADMLNEKLVVGFFRENVTIENGVLHNSDVSIPLSKFSIEEFERQLDRLIPKGNPTRSAKVSNEVF
jgi:hypothetical protein